MLVVNIGDINGPACLRKTGEDATDQLADVWHLDRRRRTGKRDYKFFRDWQPAGGNTKANGICVGNGNQLAGRFCDLQYG